jgi:hypothetical protein
MYFLLVVSVVITGCCLAERKHEVPGLDSHEAKRRQIIIETKATAAAAADDSTLSAAKPQIEESWQKRTEAKPLEELPRAM